MSCRRLELLLPASVDRRLDAGQQGEVDAHVADCSSCAADLKAMHQARQALAACGPAEPPADLAERISRSVRMAVQQDHSPSFWQRFVTVAWPAAVGATVAAAILIALVVRQPSPATESSVKVTVPADPVEQVSTDDTNANNTVQIASSVLGMEID